LRVDFHIDEISPRFLLPAEPFHEPGIALRAGVLTSDIWVDDLVTYLRGREDGFGMKLCDFHRSATIRRALIIDFHAQRENPAVIRVAIENPA